MKRRAFDAPLAGLRESSLIVLHDRRHVDCSVTLHVRSSTAILESNERRSPGAARVTVGRSKGMITVARRPEVTPWVLVVDDDPIAARAIARIVSGRIGASVSVVADADAALHLVTHASEAPVA